MKIKIDNNKNKALTIIEFVVAIVVFSLLLYLMKYLQDSALKTFNYGPDSRHLAYYKLQKSLIFIRNEIEKANYPEEVINFRTFDYNNSVNLKTIFDPNPFFCFYNNITNNHSNNFYLRYKIGNVNGGEISAPKDNECVKLISYKIYSPNNLNLIPQNNRASISTVSFYWQGITNNKPYASLLYEFISSPFDKKDTINPIELIPYVDKIYIDIPNNNTKIKITVEKSINHDITKLSSGQKQQNNISHSITIRCPVLADPSL